MTLSLTPLTPGSLSLTAPASFGPHIRYVAPPARGGSDGANGLTPHNPKATIEGAVAALPDGGVVYVAPGSYTPAAGITLAGHSIFGVNSIHDDVDTTGRGVKVNHSFDGDLFTMGGIGSSLSNMVLYNTGDFDGAAIKADAGASDSIGWIRGDNLIVTGDQSWEYDVFLDGSARVDSPIGIRSTYFTNCVFFGGATQYKTVYLNNMVHCFFTACEVVSAPSATDVGFWVDGNDSQDVFLTGCSIAGKLYSAAGGLVFMGSVPTAIECGSGSELNQFIGDVHRATFTNNGAATNFRVDSEARTYTRTAVQNFSNGIAGATRLQVSGGAGAATGVVELNNRISVSDVHGFGAFPDPGDGAIYSNKGVLMGERTDPAAPAANQAFLYTRDNGAGKTQIVARFPTGVVQIIATEP